jgi:nucleotide-binding universal stress UspA family protein
MRILIATDGSEAADRARDLAGRLPWPEGSTLRIVTALEERGDLFGAPWVAPLPDDISEIEGELIRHAEVALETAVRVVERPGLSAERILLRGRPATAIIREASEWGADLILLGHRGRGPFASMLLGSISAEVVDHGPCPVLVVRGPEPGEIVFADDGSEGARHAEAVLTDWTVFRGFPVSVVAVADTQLPWAASPTPGLYDQVLETYVEDVDAARSELDSIARETADRLCAAGIDAAGYLREGDPAHEIVAFATERKAAMIVCGTQGQTGLARLLLGSTARNVLVHAPCSVLVVREKAVVRPEEAPAGADPVAAGG